MTTTWKMIAAALAIGVGFTAVAEAQGREMRAPLDFATLDADGSGEITTEDFDLMRENRFAEIDADGNGSVSLEEFRAHAVARAGDRADAMFERLDADGDGALSRDVLERGGERGGRGMARMIDRFDANSSGGIDAEEFETAQARMAERGDRHGGKKRR